MGKWRLIAILSTRIIDGLEPVIFGYAIKLLVDEVALAISSGQPDPNKLIILALLPSAISIISVFVQMVYEYSKRVSEYKLENHLKIQLAAKLGEIDYEYFEDAKFHDRLDKIVGQSLMRFAMYVDALERIIQSTTTIISTFVSLLLHPFALLITVVTVLPTFFFQRKLSKFMLGIYENRRGKMRQHYYLFGLLTTPTMVAEQRISGAQYYLLSKFKEFANSFVKDTEDIEGQRVIQVLFMSFLRLIGEAAISLYLAFQTIAVAITVGDFAFLLGISRSFRGASTMVTSQVEKLFDSDDYVSDYFDIMQIEPNMLKAGGIKLEADKINIEFIDVWFKYPGSQRYTLRGLNFTISEGEKVAIVGQNGAGKTTLVKLLSRFYDPQKGQILINGVDLREIDLQSWYQKLGALFQDYNRYQLTVRENIGVGLITEITNLNLIRRAAKEAGADKFIESLDNKYEQILGKEYQGGMEISGGQWQKIALSRAYMRNPEVLVLDEPTASIDAKAEAEIFARLHELGKDKTLIVISHRFSTVRQMDNILVIEDGELKEQGNHEELLKLAGRYAEMYNLQAGMYR